MKLYGIYFSPTGGTKKVLDILMNEWQIEKEMIDLSVQGFDQTGPVSKISVRS